MMKIEALEQHSKGSHIRRERGPAKVLPDLHQGHAPVTLHLAFHEAVELFEEWSEAAEEPAVSVEGNAIPISDVFAKMLGCTDLMPLRTRDVLNAIATSANNIATAERGDN